MEPETSERLYKIQSYPDDFRAGILQNGTQVLIGLGVPDLIALMFDPSGNYLTNLSRKFIWPEDIVSLWELLDQWSTELGFTESTIAVKKFSLPELEVEIQDMPDHLQELLDNDKPLDDDEKEQIDLWRSEELFVLIWGRDLWLNKEGEVNST